MTVLGVSREAAIADYGVVLTGEPDEDLVSYDAAATDAARATRPALAEVFFDRGPGYARRRARRPGGGVCAPRGGPALPCFCGWVGPPGAGAGGEDPPPPKKEKE